MSILVLFLISLPELLIKSFSVILSVLSSDQEFSKVWSKYTWGILKHFQRVHEIKTIFTIIPRHDLTFSVLLSHVVKMSRGLLTYDMF